MLAEAFEMEGKLDEADKYFERAWALKEQIDCVRGIRSDKLSAYTSIMFYRDQ